MELKEIEEYILFILVAVVVKCHTRAPSHHGKGSYFVGGEPYVKAVGRGTSFRTGSPYSSYTGAYSPNEEFTQSQFSGQSPGGSNYRKVTSVNQDQIGSSYSSYPGTYSPNEEFKQSQFSGQSPGGSSYPKVTPVNKDQIGSPYSSYPGAYPPHEEFKQSQFSGQSPRVQSYHKVSPVNQESYKNDRFPSGHKGSESIKSGSEYFSHNTPTLSAQTSPKDYKSGYTPNNRRPEIHMNPFVGYPSSNYPSKNQVEPNTVYVLCDPSLAQRWYSLGDHRDDIYSDGILDSFNMNKYSPPPIDMTSRKVTDNIKMGHEPQWGEELQLNEFSKLGFNQDRFGFWDSPTKMFINDYNQDGM